MKLPKLQENDIVEVVWIDAFSVDKWTDREDMKKETKHPCVCSSVGYFLQMNKVAITLVGSRQTKTDEWNDCFAATHIPLGMVQSITKIKGAVSDKTKKKTKQKRSNKRV